MTQLQDAGFTNITVEEFSTVNKEQDGKVYSVLFDGRSSYNEGESKGKDIPIKVSVYKLNTLEVEINVSVDGEAGKPKFTIETNLPDGTKLDCALKQGNQTIATETVKVNDGKAEYTDLAKRTRPLSGTYLFTVTMEIEKQPQWAVKNKIGSSADCLVGDLVRQKDDADEQYVYLEYPYTSDYSEPESAHKISEDEMTALLDNALKSGFGSDYRLDKDDTGYTIYIWSDGNAMCAALAKAGYAAQQKSWQDIVSTTVDASLTIQNKLEENGYDDYVSVINILNDVDHDYVLCTAAMGMLLFDCTE